MNSTNDLIKKISEKDQDSFVLLFNKLSNKIKAVAFNILKDSQKSEDIVQEVMITVWQKSSGYIPLFNGERWILKIAKNKSLSALRKVKKERLIDWRDEKTVNTLDFFTDEFSSHFEDEVEIKILLDCLTPQEKLVFIMKYNKYPVEYISEVSQLSKRQVAYQYDKALQKLKKVL